MVEAWASYTIILMSSKAPMSWSQTFWISSRWLILTVNPCIHLFQGVKKNKTKENKSFVVLQGRRVSDSMPAICFGFYDVRPLIWPEIANWNRLGILKILSVIWSVTMEQRPLCWDVGEYPWILMEDMNRQRRWFWRNRRLPSGGFLLYWGGPPG